MAITTTHTFTTFSEISESGAGWSNTSNAKFSDDVYATALITTASSDGTRHLLCTGITPSILLKSIVTEVVAFMEVKRAGPDLMRVVSVRAWDGNALVGQDQDEFLGLLTSDIVRSTVTGRNWSFWSAPRINDLNVGIGIKIAATSGVTGTNTISVDFVKLEITHQRVRARFSGDSSGYLAAQHFGLVSP